MNEDFAVPSATTTTGPVTDPVRQGKKKSLMSRGIDAAKRALTPEQPPNIPDDDGDEGAEAAQPAPSQAQPLPNGLEQIAKEHGLPADIRLHVLSRCKSEALAVVAGHQRAMEQSRPVDELIDIRFAEKRHQRLLDGLPATATECLASAAALALLRDARDPLVGQLVDTAARYRLRCRSEHVEKPMEAFTAKLMAEIEGAEEKAKQLDALIGRLVPGESVACRHVSNRLDNLRQQFRHADQCRRNPVLAQHGNDGFVEIAIEASNA